MNAFEQIVAIIDGAVEPVAPEIPEAPSSRKRKRPPDDAPPEAAAPSSPPPTNDGDDSSAVSATPDKASEKGEGSPEREPEPIDIPVRGPDIGPDGKDDWTQAVLDCLDYDHSDTDNGKRIIRYFGNDLRILAQDGVPDGDWLAWTGTHWDYTGGTARAHKMAQRIGKLMMAEADMLTSTPAEERAIEHARQAAEDLQAIIDAGEFNENHPTCAALLDVIAHGKDAKAALYKRRAKRREHAVGAKNIGKIKAMLNCAGPHLRLAPDAFNADHYLVATATHTLRFEIDQESEHPDPNVKRWKMTPIPGHRREDLITAIVPWPYDPKATAPTWRKQLEYFQPKEQIRRTIQQFSGIGLTGLPVQRMMYHRGYTAANGKSTFLEVLVKVLGEAFAVGLPQESIVGNSQAGPGQASPDLVRLFGKRMVRVLELPEGAPLRQEVIKRLTGGEKVPVRALFKGYFEFVPRGKPHASGNGDPRLDGSDAGMRRRLVVIPWDVTIPEKDQRDFEEVVAELVAEATGILNWLIEGALDFLNSGGLALSDEVRATTGEYFDEMDPVGVFSRECVERIEGQDVPAREMYLAYKRWAEAAAKRVRSETYFGGVMRKKAFIKKDMRVDGRVRVVYVNVRLVNVPEATPTENSPPPHDRLPDDVRPEDIVV
jgi:putative DNA primase/helicase